MSKKTVFIFLAFMMILTVVSQSLAFSPTLTFYEDYETGDTNNKDGYLWRASGYTLTAGATYKYNGTYGGYHYTTYTGVDYGYPSGVVSYKYMDYSGKTQFYSQQYYRCNSIYFGFPEEGRAQRFLCFLELATYQVSPNWIWDLSGLILKAGIWYNSTDATYHGMIDLPTWAGYGHTYIGSSITFNLATWYRMEVLIDGQNATIKQDGVVILNALLNATYFQITNVGLVFWGNYNSWYPSVTLLGYTDYIGIWNDNVYFADDLPDITYEFGINALNAANSSSIAVPMKISDAEYYTPISVSLQVGIYIVQPEDYGFNTTHYWRFINWTDNADRTRTINFTGPASYTAYYQLSKIPSWGGYFNFFLGLAGLGMMASSWFVLKWQWDEKNYGVAILTWMLLLIVGFALCTILFGG